MLARLLSTQLIAQILSAASFLIIPNLIGLDGYGILNAVLAYLSMLQIFSLPFLEREFLLNFRELSTSRINSLFSLKIYLAIILSVVYYFILKGVLGLDLDGYVLLICLLPTTTAASAFFENAIYSIKNGRELSLILLIKNITGTLLVLGCALLYSDFMSILLARGLHQIAFCVYSYIYIYRFALVRNISDEINLSLVKKYGLFYLGNYLNFRVDIVILERIASSQELGLYSLAFRIVEKINTAFNVYYKHLLAKNKSPRENRSKILIVLLLGYVILNYVLYSGVIFHEFSGIFNLFLIYSVVIFISALASEEFNMYQRMNKFISLGSITTISGLINCTISYVLYDHFGLNGVALATLFSYTITIVLLKAYRNVYG
jgi:O-antigen/teichoic acid export membrane protein